MGHEDILIQTGTYTRYTRLPYVYTVQYSTVNCVN